MIIEYAHPEQAEQIADFARQVWTEHYAEIISLAQIDYMLNQFQSARSIRQDLEEKGYTYTLAWEANELVGYCAYRADKDSVYLSKLYVSQSHRGKRIARQFLNLILEFAQKHQKSTIYLNVNKENPSVEIYHKMGFAIKNTLVTDIGAGYIMDDYIMEREVPRPFSA